MSESTAKSDSYRIQVVSITASLVVGAALMGVKFYAYHLTDSAAILSDALESIINVVAAGFALVGVITSAMPPDENHPYGHGKIEYFSAGFEGALIILAAIAIIIGAIPKIINPLPIPKLDAGMLLVLGTSIVNCGLGLTLYYVGRKTSSLILEADGKHVLTDVYTTGGVILGLLLVRITGWNVLDGVAAILAAANIVHSGWGLVRRSFAGLMDESDPELLREICLVLNRNRKDAWIDVHKLRARRSGRYVHMDFHLILPKNLSLEDAHAEVKLLEKIFSEHFEGTTDVFIHIDPCIEEECNICSKNICLDRGDDVSHQHLWRREWVVTEKRAGFKPLNSKVAGSGKMLSIT